MNQSIEDSEGEGGALLFFLLVLLCSVLPNNIFTCTVLLLTVGDLFSEPLDRAVGS